MGVIAAMLGVLAHGVPASASATPRIRNSTAAASSRLVIRWTAHHIPHIEARTLYGIGYGEGYVQATDNLCTLADRFLTEAARRSRFFGPEATYRDQAEARASTETSTLTSSINASRTSARSNTC